MARDYVQEAYEAFIKNAEGIDPTDPEKAIEAYFERTATPELKERSKAAGKTAQKCWAFVEAVAQKALNGRSGHIDPSVVYAIAMHWYEDVPLAWNSKPAPSQVEAKKAAKKPVKKEPAKKPAKKKGPAQGFFFDAIFAEKGGGDGAQ